MAFSTPSRCFCSKNCNSIKVERSHWLAMFPANDKSVDVIWGPRARMSSVILICREEGNKKTNQDKTTMGLGIWQKMAWRLVWDKSCLPPGIWKALKLHLSHFGSSVPTLGIITWWSASWDDGLTEVYLTRHKAVMGRRKLCSMEATDKWGLSSRQCEKWESDGSHFARYGTYGLICLLELGDCASKW